MKCCLLLSSIVWGCVSIIALGETALGQEALPLSALDSQCLREAYGTPVYGRTDPSQEALPPELMADPALAESMAQQYPLEPNRPALAVGEEAGRVRSYPLLRALYGQNRGDVQRHLVTVPLHLPDNKTDQTVQKGVLLSPAAARAFARVAHSLEEATKRKPSLRSYIVPADGYAWRTIAGEQRLSPHSFGIAVDMNPNKGPYWRWSDLWQKGQGHPVQQTYPTEIVSAFEKEGFIWGGKWHKFDCMHFEYRPEILCKARKLQEERAKAFQR